MFDELFINCLRWDSGISKMNQLKYRFSNGGAGDSGDDKPDDKKDDQTDNKPEDKNDNQTNKKQDDKKTDIKDKSLTTEDIQKMIQSETDKVRTEYSKKLKALEAEKEELLKEKMTEEEKNKFEQEKRAKELADKEKLIQEREIRLKAINLLQKNEMPIIFQDFVLADSEENVEKKVMTLKEIWKKEMQEAIENKFKDHGRKPEDSKGKDTGLYTKEQLEAMTADEINANWEKVEKSLAKLG